MGNKITLKQRPHIIITQELKDRLDELVENKKESYNDVIQRLYNYYISDDNNYIVKRQPIKVKGGLKK